ncbi:hypothetical protein Taro_009952 [Colocasia esculenta]|uniref:Uncharacterized protein n=1 Tax=Colocasia esculenta TaxID=4460 RepID=A0A843U851_COLES|nr:hypothetical protein [Colocasia esculenta]
MGVAFTLPLVGGLRLHGCRVSLAGRSADVVLGKAMFLEMRGACSRCEDVVWSGGNAEGSPVFAFFVKLLWWFLGGPLLSL